MTSGYSAKATTHWMKDRRDPCYVTWDQYIRVDLKEIVCVLSREWDAYSQGVKPTFTWVRHFETGGEPWKVVGFEFQGFYWR